MDSSILTPPVLLGDFVVNWKDFTLRHRLASNLCALAAPFPGTKNEVDGPCFQLAAALSKLIQFVLTLAGQESSPNSFSAAALVEFLGEVISSDAAEHIRPLVSELLADAIWSFDLEVEAKKSCMEERIRAIEAALASDSHSHATTDPSTSQQSHQSDQLTAAQGQLEHLNQRRGALLQLATCFLQYRNHDLVLLHPEHCRMSWEYGFLHETGLLGFTADLVAKQSTRLNTGLHYKQQRFNLLREESEGFSHLATELISDMGPPQAVHLVLSETFQGEPTSHPHFNSVFTSGESLKAQDCRIDKVLNNIKALIGFFDLDPNRTLDLVLDVFCYNVTTHHEFFCAFLKKSHWIKAAGLDVSTAQEDPPPLADGTLPRVPGSKLVASLLGFKFTYYQQADFTEATPEELYLMTAILIWHKIIDIRDILPHLTPDSQLVKQFEADWREEIGNKALNAGPRNALSMAGALDGGGMSSTFMRPSKPGPEAVPTSTATKPKTLPNQKSGLLSALLSIGALREAIFLLSLPNHQFLLYLNPHQSYLLLRLIDVAITPAYIQAGVSVSHNPDGTRRPATLTQPKKRYTGGAGGTHQLIEPDLPKPVISAKVGPRPTQLVNSHLKLEPVFFWSEWSSRIRRAGSGAEFLDIVWPLLRFVGPFGHVHMGVFHKVTELTSVNLQQVNEPASDPPDPRWLHIIRWFLLPALSMMQGCVAASNLVWKILRTFPYEERYMVYGEWKERLYQRIPELKLERAKADAETKRVLKTMTLDNLKEKSRALAKLASSNPCIVFNAALNQVQTYDNLIACVIECLRYLNLFALDVLTYSIVEFLANPDKDRSKSDGTSLAAWLQNLGKFVGNVFKRNLSLDPAVVLQYIANQLSSGNAKDLIILRDLISKMAGVDVLQDLSASQVVALGGSKTLSAEAISPTTLTSKKPSHSKSSHRLMRALSESGLTVPLLLLVALQRQNAVLLANDNAHLKYLGVLADSCQQVLFQYIDFLRIQLAARSISEYEKVLPRMERMWLTHKIDPAIIFQVWRPVLSASVRPPLKIGNEGEVIIEPNHQSGPSLETGLIAPQGADPSAMVTSQLQSNQQVHYPASLADTVTLVEKMLPEQTRKLVGPHFFVTFWQLELYDIRMPDERYISETSRLNNMLSELDREYATSMITSVKEVNRSNRSKILDIRATLTKEMKIHIKHYELTRARLAAEKQYWFPLSARTPFRAQLLEHIIQHCFNPRAKLSPVDAAYTAHFIKTLHGLGTGSFMTLKLFDRIFSSDVGPTIFPCSEFEASNYGRFLKDLLLLVKSWYDSEEVFKKTGLGKDRKGNYLPGLRMKWGKAETASEGIPESDMLSYDNLQKVVKKWTAIMSTVCKEAIQSGEYMHIRNSIAVLKELDGLVPLFEDQANSLETAVTDLMKTEKREDVKVLAYGYQSMLKRALKSVIKVKPPSSVTTKKPESAPLPPPGLPGSEPQMVSTEVPSAVATPVPIPASKTAAVAVTDTPSAMLSGTPVSPSGAAGVAPGTLAASAAAPPRPAGLPERPSGGGGRLAPPPSRVDSDRGKPSVAAVRSTAANGQNRAAVELETSSRLAQPEDARPQLPPAPTPPSAEAAEREALARAAAQRSRKFAVMNAPSSAIAATGSLSGKPTGPSVEDERHPTVYPPNLTDRLFISSNISPHPPEPPRILTSVPSGPKASRTANTRGDNYSEETMRPPAIPSAPKADGPRRDPPFHNGPIPHQSVPHHPQSMASGSNNTSPRPREDPLLKRDDNTPSRHRGLRRHGVEEREIFDRREEREVGRIRDPEPRTRAPSVESLRSLRSSRDKERRTDRAEKRKRSRSPSERHRDHRDRDRERERDRDRERDRERERERERERDKEREREKKDREKEREPRHREKDKEVSREDRDRDREREREKRSHRREREKDDRRQDKEKDKERERQRERDPKHPVDVVTDEVGVKRRRVVASSHSAEGHSHTQAREVSNPSPRNLDDRTVKPISSKTELTSGLSSYGGVIPSGPRALQLTHPSMAHGLGSSSFSNNLPSAYHSHATPDQSRGRPGGGGSGENSERSEPLNSRYARPISSQHEPPSQRSTVISSSTQTREVSDGVGIGAGSRLSREVRPREGKPSSSVPTGMPPSMNPRHPSGGESWNTHAISPTIKVPSEPKKNISIKGMAATALQKANEDNARKERREPEGNGTRAAPLDVEALVSRQWDRDLSNPNSPGLSSSLLSRMDDGKSHAHEDLNTKRKRDVEVIEIDASDKSGKRGVVGGDSKPRDSHGKSNTGHLDNNMDRYADQPPENKSGGGGIPARFMNHWNGNNGSNGRAQQQQQHDSAHHPHHHPPHLRERSDRGIESTSFGSNNNHTNNNLSPPSHAHNNAGHNHHHHNRRKERVERSGSRERLRRNVGGRR